jgi:hypothetical protein
MVDSTLTPDKATPMLLLINQSLYKWKPYKVVCVLQMAVMGGIYMVQGSVPPPWKEAV